MVSPEYLPTMACVPPVKVRVLQAAVPDTNGTALQSKTPLSVKLMDPVGGIVLPDGAVTVSVNVTAPFTVEVGVAGEPLRGESDTSTVFTTDALTVCKTGLEVLVL